MIAESVLANYQYWRTREPLIEPPEIVAQLPWGTAHSALRVSGKTASGTQEFVLRFLPIAEASLALDFNQEVALMEVAASVGLAPEVAYVMAQSRVLVTEFIPGSTDVTAAQLGDLINKIHVLPANGPELDLGAQLAFYTDSALARAVSAEELIDPDYPPLVAAIQKLNDSDKVLCHNDLGRGNVISGNGRVVAIDWEYAAVGSAYFDAAAACAGWPDMDEGELVAKVFPRNFSPLLWQLAKSVYAAIEWNWYQASGAKMPHRLSRDRIAELLASLP